jgi:hypothetical protein
MVAFTWGGGGQGGRGSSRQQEEEEAGKGAASIADALDGHASKHVGDSNGTLSTMLLLSVLLLVLLLLAAPLACLC